MAEEMYDIRKNVGYCIRRNYMNFTKIHNNKLVKYGITVSQIGVLSELWIEDGQTQKQIADKMAIMPSTLTGLINNLSIKKFVTRRADKSDARIKRIFLTKEGEKFREPSNEVIKEMDSIITAGLSGEEKQMMVFWLKKIYQNLNN
jgi:MarR family transcriptional regulator, organic hydroperoxide resistance regulator